MNGLLRGLKTSGVGVPPGSFPYGSALYLALEERVNGLLKGLEMSLGVRVPPGSLLYGSALYLALYPALDCGRRCYRMDLPAGPEDIDLSLYHVRDREMTAFYRRLRRIGYNVEVRGRRLRLTSDHGRLPIDLSFTDQGELRRAAVPHERASLFLGDGRRAVLELWSGAGLEDHEAECRLRSRQDLYRFSKAWRRGFDYRPDFCPTVWDFRQGPEAYPTGPADGLPEVFKESESQLEKGSALCLEALCWKTLADKAGLGEAIWLEERIRDWLWPEGSETLGLRKRDLRKERKRPRKVFPVSLLLIPRPEVKSGEPRGRERRKDPPGRRAASKR